MNTFAPQAPVTKQANTLQNAYWHSGTLVNVLVSGSQTEGRYAQLEMTMQPGTEPPMHTHTREDETFYLVDGSIEFTIGQHVFQANPGDYVLMPKNIPHAFKVLTPTAKIVLTLAPAGFDQFFCNPPLSQPAKSMTLPPVPQGPPPAAVIVAMVQMLDQEFGIRM